MTDSMQYTTYFKHVKPEATQNTLKDSSQVSKGQTAWCVVITSSCPSQTSHFLSERHHHAVCLKDIRPNR